MSVCIYAYMYKFMCVSMFSLASTVLSRSHVTIHPPPPPPPPPLPSPPVSHTVGFEVELVVFTVAGQHRKDPPIWEISSLMQRSVSTSDKS